MKTLNRNLFVATFSLALLAGATAARAQTASTWISAVGDDSNSCSRTSPCRTFAGAISKTADKGEVTVLDSGAFGTFTISKSITINGGGTMAGVLAIGTDGITINAGTTDVVTIRNLTINGGGTGLNGIRLLQAKQVHIEDCTIANFVNRGIEVSNTSNAIQMFVRNTIIRNNVGATLPAGNSGGILLRPSSTGSISAVLEQVSLDQNTFGLRAENNSRVTMNDSTVSGNTTFGVHAITAGPGAASIILFHVAISNNATGVQAESSGLANVRLSDTMITSNSVGVSSVTGGQILTSGNNSIVGNGTNGSPTSPATPLQ